MLRFADYIAVLPRSEEELMAVLKNSLGSGYNLTINKDKTKVLVESRHDTYLY